MSKSERMTDEIDETKRIIYARSGGRCEYVDSIGRRCPDAIFEIAHIIPQDKLYVRTYGESVIHHPLNLLATCRRHNTTVELDPKTRPVEAAEHILRIHEVIKLEEESDNDEDW